MHRFFLPARLGQGEVVTIDDAQTVRHMRQSLRLKAGNTIEFFNGDGGLYTALLQKLTSSMAEAEITHAEEFPFPDKPSVILAQGMPRAGKLDDILRMNTEAGVAAFALFPAERSQGRKGEVRQDRLQRILQESSRQSERLFLPELKSYDSLSAVCALPVQHKLVLVSRSHKQAVPISQVKSSLKNGDKVLVLIGPEGGFSDSEREQAIVAGAVPVHLDLPIMRTETAGVVVCAILMY